MAIGGFALGRRIVRFLFVVYFDKRVTLRYYSSDGVEQDRRVVRVDSDDDISIALEEMRQGVATTTASTEK